MTSTASPTTDIDPFGAALAAKAQAGDGSDPFGAALAAKANGSASLPVMPDGRLLGESRKGAGDSLDAEGNFRNPQIADGDRHILADLSTGADQSKDTWLGAVAGQSLTGTAKFGSGLFTAATGSGRADTGGSWLHETAADLRAGAARVPDYQGGNDPGPLGLPTPNQFMSFPTNPLAWPGDAGSGAAALSRFAGASPQTSEDIGTLTQNAAPALVPFALREFGPEAAPESAVDADTGPAGLVGPKAKPVSQKAPASVPGERSAPVSGGGAPVGPEPLAPLPDPVAQDVTQLAQSQRANGAPMTQAQIDEATRVAEGRALSSPVELTRGMRTLDPNQISFEVNNREGDMANRMNDINQNLTQTLNTQHQNVAGPVAKFDNEAHGSNLMDMYEARDAAANAEISAKYKALQDANNGVFPVDQAQLLTNITAGLKQKLLTKAISPTLSGALDEFSDGSRPMSLEDFENLRTIAATDMRGGGQEAAAAGIVRNQLENIPIAKGASWDDAQQAATLKGLADDARAAAKARFDAIDADPAYKAVVTGKAKSTTFANKYVLNAPREDLEAMHANLDGTAQFDNTIGGITTNYLRDEARVGKGQTGNIAAASYNNAFRDLSNNGKLPLFIKDPAARDQLGLVANVSRYANARPVGNSVGPSTAGILADISPLAEAGANAASHGVAGTIAGVARMVGKPIAKGIRMRNALEPYTPPSAGPQ